MDKAIVEILGTRVTLEKRAGDWWTMIEFGEDFHAGSGQAAETLQDAMDDIAGHLKQLLPQTIKDMQDRK